MKTLLAVTGNSLQFKKLKKIKMAGFKPPFKRYLVSGKNGKEQKQ